VNPWIARPDGVAAVDAREHLTRTLMGIRKSTGKNKKSRNPAAAATVARQGTMRKATRASKRAARA
jgi:hypothetical protein